MNTVDRNCRACQLKRRYQRPFFAQNCLTKFVNHFKLSLLPANIAKPQKATQPKKEGSKKRDKCTVTTLQTLFPGSWTPPRRGPQTGHIVFPTCHDPVVIPYSSARFLCFFPSHITRTHGQKRSARSPIPNPQSNASLSKSRTIHVSSNPDRRSSKCIVNHTTRSPPLPSKHNAHHIRIQGVTKSLSTTTAADQTRRSFPPFPSLSTYDVVVYYRSTKSHPRMHTLCPPLPPPCIRICTTHTPVQPKVKSRIVSLREKIKILPRQRLSRSSPCD